MLACMRTIYGLILALFDEAGIRSLVVGLQGFEVWGASELLQRGFEFFRTDRCCRDVQAYSVAKIEGVSFASTKAWPTCIPRYQTSGWLEAVLSLARYAPSNCGAQDASAGAGRQKFSHFELLSSHSSRKVSHPEP